MQLLTGVTKPHFNVVRGIKPVALHNPGVNGKVFDPRAHNIFPVVRVPQASGNLPIRKELRNAAGLKVLRAFPDHCAHQMIAAHSAIAVFQNPRGPKRIWGDDKGRVRGDEIEFFAFDRFK